MKSLTTQWKFLTIVTAINVLVATGYAIAGIIAPQSILPVAVVSNNASFIFALYAAARTIPLAIVVIYSIFTQNKKAILILGVLAGFIQFTDGFIGIYQHDIMKSGGPFFLAFIQFSVLFWINKNDKNN